MRTWSRDERGGSAVEAGLLIAAMTLVLLPVLFMLGRVVDTAIQKPCTALSGATCDGGGSGGAPGGGPGPGGGATSPTQVLEARVAGMVPDPGGGTTSATCDNQVASIPPRGSTASCTLRFSSDGSSVDYDVVWVDDAGSIRVTPA